MSSLIASIKKTVEGTIVSSPSSQFWLLISELTARLMIAGLPRPKDGRTPGPSELERLGGELPFFSNPSPIAY